MTLVRNLIVACTLATAVAVTAAQVSTPVVPGIDVAGMDLSVRPQDDFFRYVNGRWVDNTPIPADLSSYGTFAILRDRSQEAVRTIIEAEGRSQAAPGINSQKVGDLYKSFMDEARLEALGITPLKDELSAIARISDGRELPAAFARAARLGVRLPFSVNVGADQRNSEQYAVQVGQSGLGMPDRDYYLRNDEKFAATRKAYNTYIARLFALGNQAEPEAAAARLVSLETKLAELQWDRARNRDRNATYNKTAVSSLQTATPHFDWQAYFAAVGALAGRSLSEGGQTPVRDVIVRQPDYLTGVDALLASVPLATWKEYLTFGLISEYANSLSAPFADSQFEFNGKVLSGRQVQPPRWKRGVTEVEQALGEPVGRLYIEQHFKPEAKARMDALIRNLLAAFKVGIDELEWMSPATKREAQAKLAKYRLKIAYPDQWRDYSALEIKPGDHIGNEMRFRAFQSTESWSRLGQPMERWRWNFTPQTVNASYSSTNNEITFPAGILQPPFFGLDADDAINYGAIGSVIGHEISHGFDDQGRKSDGDGVLTDWWTPGDTGKFTAQADRLGAQYSAFEPIPGAKVQGGLTMGENIGDKGGVSLALDAYRTSLKGAPAPVIDGLTGDQRVFLGWAQVWRQKSRDEALRQQVVTDPHSPAYYRVNGTIRNIGGWYQAWDIQAGDKLYVAPDQRVNIW